MSGHDPMAAAGQSLPQPPAAGPFGGPAQTSTPIGQAAAGYTVPSSITQTPLPQAGALGPSVSRGILCGLGAAVLGGTVWYFVVTLAERQVAYLAIALGLFIGYAVSWGAGKGGPVTAAISALIAAVGVVAAYFYIGRYFFIEVGEAAGYIVDLPLIPSYDEMKAVLRVTFEEQSSQYLYCALCVGAAGFFGFKGIEQSQRFGRR